MDQYNAVVGEQGAQTRGVQPGQLDGTHRKIDANKPRRLTNNNQTTQGAESGPGGSVLVKGLLTGPSYDNKRTTGNSVNTNSKPTPWLALFCSLGAH